MSADGPDRERCGEEGHGYPDQGAQGASLDSGALTREEFDEQKKKAESALIRTHLFSEEDERNILKMIANLPGNTERGR